MTVRDLTEELGRGIPGLTVIAVGEEIDGIRPSAVVQPRDADQVAAILRFASEQGLSVIPRGGGTAIEQGNRPHRLDLLLDMTGINRVLEHRPRDLTVTVEAGITLGALQEALAMHGQMLPLDPPLGRRATVGGVLAANGWGPRRQRYGTARDLVIGSRAVLADGTRVRSGGKVVKNVAGYDLNKLLIGSAGTLAVIVEATLKVTPLPAAAEMVVATFPGFAEAHAVALAVTNSRLQPLTLDIVGPGAAEHVLDGSGSPAGVAEWALIAEVGGSPAAVDRTRDELLAMTAAGGARATGMLGPSQREVVIARLRDYGHADESRAPLILRAAVLPSQSPAVIEALERLAAEGARPAVIVRAGSGVVYSFWSDVAASDAPRVVTALRAALATLGGTVVVERMPAGRKDELDVWGIEGPDVGLMRRVKDAYDPSGVLSPGRV